MSWGGTTTATTAAAAAAASVPEIDQVPPPPPPPPPQQPLCFACSRCEYPICSAADLLLSAVPGGTTDYAFAYALDCLLDLDEGVAVPCYCGEETVDTAIIVSERLLAEPLPPAARVMCMESIVESRRFLKAQQTVTAGRMMHVGRGSPTTTATTVAVNAATTTTTTTPDATTPAAAAASAPRPLPAVRRASSSAALARHDDTGPAVGPEHDLQLAESIPEHGSADPADGAGVAGVHQGGVAATRVETAEDNTASGDVAGGDAGRTHVATLSAPVPAPSPTAAAATDDEQAAPVRLTIRPIRRYGATTEARVDMVCIASDVLSRGLSLSSRDRSSTVEACRTGIDDDEEDDDTNVVAASSSPPASSSSSPATATAPTPARARVIPKLPRHIIDGATRPPPRTAWGPPGNLTVEEAFMIVTRATSSAQGQWFRRFLCEHRVECPDCHLPLGFLFERRKGTKDEQKAKNSTSGGHREDRSNTNNSSKSDGAGGRNGPVEPSGEGDNEEEESVLIERDFRLPPGPVPVFASLAVERERERAAAAAAADGVDVDSGHDRRRHDSSADRPPLPKRAKEEDDDEETRRDGQRHARHYASGRTDGDNNGDKNEDEEEESEGEEDAFPDVFIGLELKRITQREWGLREFQDRYARSQSLRSFRALFPEAEELQSLYSRLSALRTQTELYNNLLRKHKEQNDVQTSLLRSQKDRLFTSEEKLRTMQQIIDAQQLQLRMQLHKVQQHTELLEGQRSQVATQRQQIHVEQLLIGEQSRALAKQSRTIAEQSRVIEEQQQQLRATQARVVGRAAEGVHLLRRAPTELERPLVTRAALERDLTEAQANANAIANNDDTREDEKGVGAVAPEGQSDTTAAPEQQQQPGEVESRPDVLELLAAREIATAKVAAAEARYARARLLLREVTAGTRAARTPPAPQQEEGEHQQASRVSSTFSLSPPPPPAPGAVPMGPPAHLRGVVGSAAVSGRPDAAESSGASDETT